MRSVVRGVVYDTESATLICRSDGWGCRGSLPMIEKLYRGQGGGFFKAVEYPGERTLLMRLLTGNFPGGKVIHPVSNNEALSMMVDHGLSPEQFGLRPCAA